MNYYSLCFCEHAVKNPLICFSNLEELKIDDKRFNMCKKFTDDENKSRIQFFARDEEADGTPDDGLQDTDMIPVFSPRLIKALNDEGISGIQYIPVDVLNYKKERFEGFCIANIITSVSDALDFEKSMFSYDEDDGKIFFVWKYALKFEKIKELDIFRLKYDDRFYFPYSKILVSERFKSIFTKNKFTGYSFSREIVE